MKGSDSVRQIGRVYIGGDEIDVEVPGTNLQWFPRFSRHSNLRRSPPQAKTSNRSPRPSRPSTPARMSRKFAGYTTRVLRTSRVGP